MLLLSVLERPIIPEQDERKAVALRPDLPEALVARSEGRALRYDWAGARADAEHALASAPGSALTQLSAGKLLASLGELPAAVAALRNATEIDPLSDEAWWRLGFVYLGTGELARGQEAATRGVEIAPESHAAVRTLGFALLLQGQPSAALAVFARAPEEFVRVHGAALAEQDPAGAKQAMEVFVSKYGFNFGYQIAETYAWRGERDRAFDWLERARAAHDGGIAYLKFDPLLRNLRSDARWSALLKKMNLPVD
jgi:serine/threonine-protein kinase